MSQFKQYLRESIQYALREEILPSYNYETGDYGEVDTETGVWHPHKEKTRTKGEEGTHFWHHERGWVEHPVKPTPYSGPYWGEDQFPTFYEPPPFDTNPDWEPNPNADPPDTDDWQA
jgi:hypothetical protein